MNREKMFLTVIDLMRIDTPMGQNTTRNISDVLNEVNNDVNNEDLTEKEKEHIKRYISGYKKNVEKLCDYLNKGIDVIEITDKKLKFKQNGQMKVTFFSDERAV